MRKPKNRTYFKYGVDLMLLSPEDRRKRRMEINKRWRYNTRSEAMALYGGKCAGCGMTESCCLSFDHVDDDGADHRRLDPSLKSVRLASHLLQGRYPVEKIQVLCMNCRYRKRTYGKDISKWPSV